jgi:hypothetical protein
MLRGHVKRPKGMFKWALYLFIIPMGIVLSLSLILILLDVPFNLGFLLLIAYSISGILALIQWLRAKIKKRPFEGI